MSDTEKEMIRQSIRLTSRATKIIRGRATETWPGLEGNITGLINQVIVNWDVIRDDPGGPATKVNARITHLEQENEQLKANIASIKRHLKIEDLDHVQS